MSETKSSDTQASDLGAGAFVGIQIGPISFADEGVEPLLDMLGSRFGINALLVGTCPGLA